MGNNGTDVYAVVAFFVLSAVVKVRLLNGS
jgi:hypothetical protein